MNPSEAATVPASSPGMPGISIIIPTRNRKHYLGQAIDSILRQDYPCYEILLVDDGSTDGTREFLAAYGDKIRYFRQEGVGPSAARNFAARHARFDYLAFLDSDDYWAPNRLRALMEVWNQLPSDFGLLANDISLFNDEGKHFNPKRMSPLRTGETTQSQLLLRNRFAPSAAIMKREIYEKCHGYDESLFASEDRDLWIRAGKISRIHFLAERLTFMRKHPKNISKEADRMRQSIHAMLSKSFRDKVVPRWRLDIWLRARSFGWFIIACLMNHEGRKSSAWNYLLWSALSWPIHIHTKEDLNEPFLFRLRMVRHFLSTQRHSRGNLSAKRD